MKKILSIILMLITINVSAQFKLSEYPDSVIILNDSSFFDVSRFNGGGSFTSSKMRALRLPPFILKGWAFDPVDSSFYPIFSGKNIGRNTNRIDTLFLNSVFAFKNTSDLSFWNDTIRMIIKPNGNIGINNSIPISILDVTAIATNDGIVLNNTSGTQHVIIGTSNTGGRIRLEDNAGTVNIFSINDISSSFDFFNTGRRLGINETSPTSILDVKALTVNDGIVFKNTSGVQHALLATSASGGRLRLEDNAGSTTIFSINPLSGDDFLSTGNNFGIGLSSSITAKLHVKGINAASGTSNTLMVDNVNTKLFDLKNDGSLIIGNPTGGAKGPGTINAQAVFDDNVLLTDYVFEKDYKQMTIAKMERYFKRYKHLPTIGGRDEWNKNGKPSMGQLINEIWETVEIQAKYIAELHKRITKLEKK